MDDPKEKIEALHGKDAKENYANLKELEDIVPYKRPNIFKIVCETSRI